MKPLQPITNPLGDPLAHLGINPFVGNPFGPWPYKTVRRGKFTKLVPRMTKATIPLGALIQLNPRLLK